MTGRVQLLDLDPATYVAHPLHSGERIWPETNCYVDLWVELLHACGHDPVAGLAFTLGVGFDGEQWEFFKYPPHDLEVLYGIDVGEINVWRDLPVHIAEHLRLGHLLTVEVDSWYLPDTAGVAYGLAHQKTTIAPQMLDVEARRLGYFHNAGYHQLDGDDFVGALRATASPDSLVPYVERVELNRGTARQGGELREAVDTLVRAHLRRSPRHDPVAALGERITADVDWLRSGGDEQFHAYAFGTLRQLGSWAELAGAFVRWLDEDDLAASAAAFVELAETAKTAQFTLARVARGRAADLAGQMQRMSTMWQQAYDPLRRRYG